MKNKVSILFVGLAVTLLSLLELIPHHHHDQTICWGTECHQQQQDCCSNHHQHNHDSSCVMEDGYLFSHPDNRFDLKALILQTTNTLYIIPEKVDLISATITEGLIYLYRNLRHIFAEEVTIAACGLRAPPAFK